MRTEANLAMPDFGAVFGGCEMSRLKPRLLDFTPEPSAGVFHVEHSVQNSFGGYDANVPRGTLLWRARRTSHQELLPESLTSHFNGHVGQNCHGNILHWQHLLHLVTTLILNRFGHGLSRERALTKEESEVAESSGCAPPVWWRDRLEIHQ
jgi:hypothetical protein